jgi:hypothetical protein
MKKFRILIILLFGIFLMPSVSYACGGGNDSCKKEMKKCSPEKKSCCGDKRKPGKGCDGKCGHSKCGCSFSPSNTPINLSVGLEIQNSNFQSDLIQKNKIPYSSPSISDGFYSIWLIPKIS